MPQAYDPAKPATIHNPLPQRQWPIRKNEAVVFIDVRFTRPGHVCIQKGKIRFYNPATHGSCVVTKGKPFFTIELDNGSATTCQVSDVFRDNKKGRRLCELRKAAYLRGTAASQRAQADQMYAAADDMEAEAERIEAKLK